jgi:uncharacterized membrane protein
MIVAVLIALLALSATRLRLPPFETTFGILLLVPIAAFPLGDSYPRGAIGYGVVLALLLALTVAVSGRARGPREISVAQDLESIGVFLALFALNLALCLTWPDFIAMGERLRDFAILASVDQSPVVPREPWLSGATLNYYLYWYRLGDVLGAFGQLSTWELYPQLQAFTFALFAAAVFHLFRAGLGVSAAAAFGVTFVIAYGSNIAGILDFIEGDTNWWGPSRVIVGAINEFPAWSFLLGDLHPHFMNLALAPFLVVLVRAFLRGGIRGTVALLTLLAVAPWLFFNANAWEVPVWGGFVVVGVAAVLVRFGVRGVGARLRAGVGDAVGDQRCWAIVLGGLYLMVSLYLSSRQIAPGDTPVSFVRGAIARSTLFDFLRHWGVPLGLITGGLIALMEPGRIRLVALLSVAAASFGRDPLPLLVVLTGLSAFDLWDTLRVSRRRIEVGEVLLQILGLGALVSLAVPEVVFLDDPYGGENERMNTIFKIYAATWFAVHLYAFSIGARCVRRWRSDTATPWWFRGSAVVAAILMCGFFFQTTEVRRTGARLVEPHAQGLSEVTRLFPGAGPTIQALERLPRGTVLEAQGPAYDYTTHVATLSGNAAYLGWANHVNLLTREYGEVARREQVTREVYGPGECRVKEALLAREGITYVVLGPLERKAHPGATPELLSCLNQVIALGDYTVFRRAEHPG